MPIPPTTRHCILSSLCSGFDTVLRAHVRCTFPQLEHVHQVLCTSVLEEYVTGSGLGAALGRGRQIGHASSSGRSMSVWSPLASFVSFLRVCCDVFLCPSIAICAACVGACVAGMCVSCVCMRVNLLVISIMGSAAAASYGGWPLFVSAAVVNSFIGSGGRPSIMVALANTLILDGDRP